MIEYDSARYFSPSAERGRGRGRDVYRAAYSRSASPSVLPATPGDFDRPRALPDIKDDPGLDVCGLSISDPVVGPHEGGRAWTEDELAV